MQHRLQGNFRDYAIVFPEKALYPALHSDEMLQNQGSYVQKFERNTISPSSLENSRGVSVNAENLEHHAQRQ
jgi:hypothetical protein